MNRPALLTLVVLAGVGIPLDGLADTGAETFLAPVITSDSAAAAESGTARDTLSAPDSVFVPDPLRIALVEFALRDFDEVRVFTDSTRFFSRRVIASPEGIRLRQVTWRRSITDNPEERLVPWSEVESIKVRRGASGTGPLAGAMIGLAIGSAIYMAQVPAAIFSLGKHQPSATPILVGFLGGATLGALVDRAGPWRTVYP